MMTLRRYLTAKYDWTGISSKIYRSKAWEIGALFFVGAFVLLLAGLYHVSVVGLPFPEFTTIPMGLEHMFGMISVFTWCVFLIPLVFLLSNAVRMYWLTMHTNDEVNIPFSLYFAEAKTLLLQVFMQERYRECADKNRWIKHLLLVSGCGLISFLVLFFLEWFQTDNIYPIYHPQRWLGYLATVAIIYATGDILIGRIRKREQIHKFSDLSDWILPILLLLTTVTGIAVHIFRYLELSLASHYMYALHLVIVVPMLVVEIPFGKWSHMLYRPLAMYFLTVKEKALQQQLPKEEIVEHVE